MPPWTASYLHLDDSPILASLLDQERSGRFSISALGGSPTRQPYLPDTSVLLMRLLGQGGQLEVTDLMSVEGGEIHSEEQPLARARPPRASRPRRRHRPALDPVHVRHPFDHLFAVDRAKARFIFGDGECRLEELLLPPGIHPAVMHGDPGLLGLDRAPRPCHPRR